MSNVLHIRNCLPGLLALLLFCAQDYNPFADPSVAATFVVEESSSISDGDSLEIYSTQSLTLVAAPADQIASVEVTCGGSRFFEETTFVSPGSQEMKLNFSYPDTGIKKINITTKRTNGDRITQTLSLLLFSPLSQATIDTTIDIPITLSTQPVDDSVWYHWAWGDLIPDTVHGPYREYSHIFDRAGTFSGNLWVSSDRGGIVNPSPATAFSLTLEDYAGPYISVPGFSTDTIITSDKVFALETYIKDGSGLQIVSINGKEFEYVSPPRYTSTFRDLDSYPRSSPRDLLIYAQDRTGNASSRELYLAYDADAPGNYGTQIASENVRDTITTPLQDYLIVGTVTDFAEGLYLREVYRLE